MTMEKKPFAFNLPFNQSPSYWLTIFVSTPNPAFSDALIACGMQKYETDNAYILHIENQWHSLWMTIKEAIKRCNMMDKIEVALLPAEKQPDVQEFSFVRKPPEAIDNLADSLWLGKALLEDRIVCFMQPVIDERGKVFGYEAFARAELDGNLIGGGKIIEAGKQLNAEYALDRYLHLKAISTFISSDLDGVLFINLIPGFIHRPEKYLEGLSDAVKYNGMPPRQVVLDFTKSETPRDISHLKAIFDYCRSHGYSLSLDDISSVTVAKKILETVRPDFIKLDIDLVRNCTEEKNQNIISELVAIARSSGVTVIAEGVETEEAHKELKGAGVNLFQGYLFSPPVGVSKLKKVAG